MYPVRLLAQALFQAQYVDTRPAASVSTDEVMQVYVAASEATALTTPPAQAPAGHRRAFTVLLYHTEK
jgi:hypothetical protein